MSWIDLLRMSSSNLRRRKLRTFLTVLGVMIGATSIVVMISLGLGLQQSMYEEIERYGGITNLTVSGKGSEGQGMMMSQGSDDQEPEQFITDQTIKDFQELEHVEAVHPVIAMNVIMTKGRYITYYDELVAYPADELAKLNLELEEEGRLPEAGSGSLELLFGNVMPAYFMDKNSEQSYWETGELPDINFQKDQFGVIFDVDNYMASGDQDPFAENSKEQESKPAAKKYMSQAVGLLNGGVDGSYNVHSFRTYCELETLKRILKKEFAGQAIPGQPVKSSGKPYPFFTYTYANVKVDKMENVETMSNVLREMGYSVESNVEALNSQKSTMAMIQAVLGGIGAVSLLVAAIGITNTMMMSIYERTKEIGVLKVLGCGLKNIKQLFLLEAAGIGLIGGISGNIFSLIVSKLINLLVSSQASEMAMPSGISYIPWWLLLVAMGIAIGVGMIAGYFPARRAMKLSPLEAIRTN